MLPLHKRMVKLPMVMEENRHGGFWIAKIAFFRDCLLELLRSNVKWVQVESSLATDDKIESFLHDIS